MRAPRFPLHLLIALLAIAGTRQSSALDIQINPGPGLAMQAEALAAFERAAQIWELRLLDPIIVQISADLAMLGPGIIGDASSTLLYSDNLAEFRSYLLSDDAAEGGNPAVQALPTFMQLSASLPPNYFLSDEVGESMFATKANLKALGFSAILLDQVAQTANDATIRFSLNFSFDYDNRDGVDFDKVDFETVAAHELGHALGFISGVDDLTPVTQATPALFTLLDLFRFPANNAPLTIGDFTSNPRSLKPGEAAVFSDLGSVVPFSTGLDGDGNQASHWKESPNPTDYIGIMDPTLANGTIELPTPADLRAFDAIGYQVVPEPAAAMLAVAGVSCLLGWRRRRVG